jgi:thiol-disulfide isomerase/thioredoxin
LKTLLALLLLVSAELWGAEFTLTDSQGQAHRLSDYRGKWVLVNFWATWCPPCLDEIPELVELHDARKSKDLVVIGIAMQYQDAAAVLKFAETMFVSYPIVLGSPAIVGQIGKIEGLPTTFLFDPQGRLALRHVGPLTKKGVERYIHAHSG